MTDNSIDQSDNRNKTLEQDRPQLENSVQLQYPQLLLEASLHSLLSHSYSSGSVSTVRNMPRTGPSLSESWASFSDADFSQDDDLTSEATDAGSLIDVNSAQDVHSMNEDGDSSDAEDHEEAEHDRNIHFNASMAHAEEGYDLVQKSSLTLPVLGASTEVITKAQQENAHDDPGSTDRQIDQPIEEPGLPSSTVPEYSSSSHSSPLNRSKHDARSLPLSKSLLEFGQRPFRILYFESRTISNSIKTEVLSKIGAMLISGAPAPVDSDCFYVVRSEFGPGSNSATAELIPIPTQMIIHECKQTMSHLPNTDFPELQLHGSGTIRQIPGKKIEVEDRNGHWYQPDLLVLLISEDDPRPECETAEGISRLAQACFLPQLVLLQESGKHPWQARPYLESHGLQPGHGTHIAHAGAYFDSALEVDHFLNMDSAELLGDVNTLIQEEAQLYFASRGPHGHVGKTGVFKWLASLKPEEDRAQEIEKPEEASRVPPHNSPPFIDGRWLIENVSSYSGALVLALLTSLLFTGIFLAGSSFAPQSIGTRHIEAPSSSVSDCRRDVSVSPVSIPDVSSPLEEASTKTASLSLLSEKLREVAEYLPKVKAVSKALQIQERDPVKPVRQSSHWTCDKTSESRKIHRGATLTVPTTFFSSGDANFKVRVRRGQNVVPFSLKKHDSEAYYLKTPFTELYGRLTVELKASDMSEETVCARIDLADTPMERLSHLVSSSKLLSSDGKTRDWFLLRIHPREATTWTGFPRQMKQKAVEVLESAVLTIEDTIANQAVACHDDAESCWGHKIRKHQKNLVSSVQQSAQFLITSGQQAHEQAVAHASDMLESASNALDVVRESIPNVKQLSSKVSRKAARKAAKAQKRARKLVHKHRKNSCGSKA